MYQSTGKPSIPKFRGRCERILECSQTGLELAERWNPKGRNAQLQSLLIETYKANVEMMEHLLAMMNGRRT